MKKKILSVGATFTFIFLYSFICQAQIKNDKGTFEKPAKGTLLIETQVTPNIVGGTFLSLNDLFLQNLSDGLVDFSGEGTPSNPKVTLPMLKGRYFIKDDMAVRAMFNLAWGSNKVDDGDQVSSISTTGIAVGGGVEKHFAGAERLSTYVGGDLLVGWARNGMKDKNNDVTVKMSQATIGVGLRGVTGFDYYFIPKVYLGAELGYGLMYQSIGVIKKSGGELEDEKEKRSNLAISPFITPSFRLGFRF